MALKNGIEMLDESYKSVLANDIQVSDIDQDPSCSDVTKQAHLPSTKIMHPSEHDLSNTYALAPFSRAGDFAKNVNFSAGHKQSVLKGGQHSDIERAVETKMNGQKITLARKILKQPVSDGFKHFAQSLMRLRSGFLVPVLEIRDEPMHKFILTSPYMTGGNLENRLHRPKVLDDIKVDCRAWAVKVAYQVSAGIAFLHERNIVHGNINLRHILFDRLDNARLVDYGMYAHQNAEPRIQHCPNGVRSTANFQKCLALDVHSFAAIILQLLKPSVSDEEVAYILKSLTTALQNLSPESQVEEFQQMYLDQETWPRDGITSQLLTRVLFECCQNNSERTTFNKLNENLKAIMKLFSSPIPRTPSVDSTEICLYCSVESVHSELMLRRTLCPESCPYLKGCISCLMKFGFGSRFDVENDVCDLKHRGSHFVEVTCPVHECIIEPVLGGSRSRAMILHDASKNFADCTKCDAVNILQLVTHPNVMQMPFKNVHKISIPSAMNMKKENFQYQMTQTCKRVKNEMQDIIEGHPTYFLFYYSGHELVEATNKEKPLADYAELIITLKEYINKIAEFCPRILMIIDCCYSPAVAGLFRSTLKIDDHVEWHAQLTSCNWNQKSEYDCEMSAFTKLMVSALKGGTIQRECPIGNPDCKVCSTFRSSCIEKGYLNLDDITKFVKKHMQSGQNPMNCEYSSDCERAISFVNMEPQLYNFVFESQYDNAVQRFATDDLTAATVWDMTNEHH